VRQALLVVLLCQAAPWSLAQDALLARNLAATCFNCHGTDGHAVGEMSPLAGLPSEKMLTQMADYRSGALPATVMHQIARGYTDAQLRLIAEYFAAQPARR
jgi:cytochrome c553